MSPCRAAFLVAGLLVAGPASAGASGRSAALLPQLKPAGSPELRDRFQEAITRGLTQGNTEAVAAAEIRMRFSGSDELTGCAGPGPCAARAAMQLHVDLLVASEIGVSGKDYTIKLRALDAAGREIGKADESCDICTVKEADEAIARATQKLASATSAIATATAPPVEKPAPPVEKPAVVVPPAPVVAPAPALAPPAAVATQPVEHHGGKFPWRLSAIISLSVGLVGIIIGAPLVAIDGSPTCGSADPVHSCKDLYNTAGGGGALLGLGLAGVAASGVLFYLDYRSRRQHQTALQLIPTVGGAMAALGGRF